MEQKIHQGRNLKRFREMLGVKQESLAFDLGEDWNQKKISMLEQKDVIDYKLLKQISEVLKIPVEAFDTFSEEHVVNIISNTVDNGNLVGCQTIINPIDKIVQLYDEKTALYERMLKEKDDIMRQKDNMLNTFEKLIDKLQK
ncbi:helix-turn-helix domain-containing protein [Flavobacterium hercynium]|uniref:Transcriptional regulator n=1 Tax=Flavobacterium hercynium TaxID=387094 RepID=A0A226HFM8_9FLAO|nr:helix-turn-helix transcriptional regulator [Flavobacterium hercynium]OXA92466.1 transcriptional regulator [Flavobacterium hercynium]SMP22006.1 Helix-turn-helix domain-containing protein [Flavobacterium hercynium]